MKIKVTLKCPDALEDAVCKAVANEVANMRGISYGAAHSLSDQLTDEIIDTITTQWMDYAEYLTVEFDTEAGTATVVNNAD